jgi:hypothetical protein
MTIFRCRTCGTPHDSFQKLADCCDPLDDDFDDDQGAAPVVMADGGQIRPRQSDDPVDARQTTIAYLRDLVDPGDDHVVLARHVSGATAVSSHTAGRTLARLAGQTDGIGGIDGAPADLEVERAWEGSTAVRWRVTRIGRDDRGERA